MIQQYVFYIILKEMKENLFLHKVLDIGITYSPTKNISTYLLMSVGGVNSDDGQLS